MHLVAPVFEREDLKGLIGRIADPILLHAEASVELLLVVAVAADAGGRDQFDEEIRSSEDGALLDDTEVGAGNENEVGLHGIFRIQDNVHRRNEDFAQPPTLHVVLQDDMKLANPSLM